MPYRVRLERPPSGIAINAGREGDQIAIAYRDFTSSEDGDLFISRLEGLPATILSLLPASPQVRPSTIDHLVALVKPDGETEVFVNELTILANAKVRRTVQKGDPLFEGDIVDIVGLRFDGLTIPNDVGVLALISQGWRKGLFFDFGPLLPMPVIRDFDIERVMGSLFGYLTFQQHFKITDDEWARILACGWFPFVGLERDALELLLSHIRNGWDPDQVLNTVASNLKNRIETLTETWQSQPILKPHFALLSHALERFKSGDFISATTILYTRIEGLLRDIHTGLGGTSFKQEQLAQAPMKAIAPHSHQFSRLLPARFRQFLETVYFAPFSPNAVSGLSRHSVAHGVAPVDLFSLKAATVGILTVEQLCFHVPPSNPPIE